MKIFDTAPGLYRLQLLPSFARYILDNKLEEFAEEQLRLSFECKVPLLKYVQHLSKEQLMNLNLEGVTEFLGYIERNEAREQVRDSIRKWLANDLAMIQKFEVIIEDITLINYIRSESFRKFIPGYTNDLQLAMGLMGEIDRFTTGASTSSLDTYIQILKENISTKESQLLEAQSIASMGSFEWDIRTNEGEISANMNEILENDPPNSIAEFEKKIHTADLNKAKAALEIAYETGFYDMEFRYCLPDKIKHFWSRARVTFEDGKPAKIIGTLQDITGRKMIEQNLLSKTLELERSNEELQQFASVASHDLKEPLRKITMFTDLIETSDAARLSESSQKNLERIKDASKRMQSLIEDILSYSTLNHTELQVRVSLEDLLEEVIENVETQKMEKNASITSDKLPEASVIPFQFKQLFQNLISNALKFTRENVSPKIRITHRFLQKEEVEGIDIISGKYLQIKVCDNGIGFSQEQAGKIFALFNRLHPRSVYEGTGLGLAICRKVAENHGGTISAESQPGIGSCFIITIPQ